MNLLTRVARGRAVSVLSPSARRILATTALFVLVPLIATGMFVNGGFENGDFAGWTKGSFLNYGLTGVPPFHGGSITRTGGGTDQSIIVSAAAPETGIDPVLGSSATLKYPKYGAYAARVNGTLTGRVSNTITQQATITAADVDPEDGLVHIRFAYAPVLEDPSHPDAEQPYFFIRLINRTKSNAVLFESLHFSDEPGVPWKRSALNANVLYTDWRIADVAPGNDELSVGDTVEIEVIGADCAQSGHYGYVYIDSFGTARLPGLTVLKTADKDTVAPGERLTYTLAYRNAGSAAVANVIVSETLPAQTVFVSASEGCSASGGVVTCAAGTVAPGSTGSFSVSVDVISSATGSIHNGNYTIAGDGFSPTIGPSVTTPVSTATTDVQLAMAAPATVIRPATIAYTITATNAGAANAEGVTVTDTLPAGLAFVSVSSTRGSCTGATRVTCSIGTLAPGASELVTLTVRPNANGTFNNAASVSGSYTDPDRANDIANASTVVEGLAVAKSGPSASATDELVTYTLTAGNETSLTATSVVMRDPVPAGTTFISATGGGTESNGTVTWTIPFLASGETQSVSMTVVVDALSGLIRNQNYTIEASGVGAITGIPVVTALQCPLFDVQPASVPAGTQHQSYSPIVFTASGATPPYTFSVTGPLPSGMSLVNGTLSGTPTAAGSFPITVTATDANGCSRGVAMTLAISSSCGTAVVSGSATSCRGAANVITAALDGVAPFTIVWSDGLIQSGIETATVTRTVSPTTTTTYTITSVSDSRCTGTATGSATITVTGASAAISAGPNACPGQTGLIASTQDAGPGASYVWSVENGAITSGQGTPQITYTAGSLTPGVPGAVLLSVEVTAECATTVTRRVLLTQPGEITGGGPDGAMFQVFIHPRDSQRVFAGTNNGGVYVSEDEGLSWTRTAPQYVNISAFATTPADPHTIYASAPCSGVIRSTDGGTSWSNVSGDLPYRCVGSVAVDAVNPQLAYVYVGDGYTYRTLNGGATWLATSLPNSGSVPIVVDPLVTGVAWAGGPTGLWKTVDSGATWTSLPNAPAMTSFVADPATSGVLWGVHPHATLSQQVLYRSTDGGATWTANTTTVPLPRWEGDRGSIVVDPTAPGTLYLLSFSEIAKSTDAGVSWTLLPHPWRSVARFSHLSIDRSGQRLIVAGYGDAYASTDGGASWHLATGGIHASWGRSLAFDPARAELHVGTESNGHASSLDGGATWVRREALAHERVTSLVVAGPGQLFAVANGKVVASEDAGLTWSERTNDAFNAFSVAYSAYSNLLVATSGTKPLHTSSDRGLTWLEMGPTPRCAAGSGCMLQVVVDDPAFNLYALGDGLAWSDDVGASWSMIAAVPFGDECSSLYLQKSTSPATLWVGCRGKVIRGDAQTGNWASLPLAQSTASVSAITVHPSDPLRLYAVIEGTVNRSVDGGFSWTPIHAAYRDIVTSILLDPLAPSRVYAGTVSSGVWVIDDLLPLAVHSVSPSSGPAAGGTPVTINGVGFDVGTRVSFGGAAAGSVQFVDSTTITATTPPGSEGPAEVVVTRSDCGSAVADGAFEYTAAPVVSAVVSGSGSICAGGSHSINAVLTGAAPWTIQWSDGVIQNGIVSSPVTRVVSPATSTTYTILSVADAGGPGTTSGSATVTVAQLPTATVLSPAACPSSPTANIQIDLTGTAPWTIEWADGLIQSNITSSPAFRSVTPSGTTSYVIKSITDASCSSNAMVVSSIFVIPSSVPISAPTYLCATGCPGRASAPDYGPMANYVWTMTHGSILGGNGTREIDFWADGTNSVTLSVTVTSAACNGGGSGGGTTTIPMQVCATPSDAYVFTHFAGTRGGAGWYDGTGSTARFYQPQDVAVDSVGNVYVADGTNHTIRWITPAGVVTTLAGLAGVGGSADGTGSAARFRSPSGVAVDAAGNVYVADRENHTIRKITPGGVVTTLAGLAGSSGSSDGSGSSARFSRPNGVAVDSSGTIYVADGNSHTIRKVTSSGQVTTLAGLAGNAGSSDGSGSAARFSSPSGVAVDGSGNVYVSDWGNETIRKVTSAGSVTTLAGSAGIRGSVDGSGSAARFAYPTGVAVDANGNVYVSDSSFSTIRKVSSLGDVTTVAGTPGSGGSADGIGGAARFLVPQGIAVDASGTVYVADYGNHAIRRMTPTREVTTFAGLAAAEGFADGPGDSARFSRPRGIAVDRSGYVYVSDDNHTIRKLTPDGTAATFAGVPGAPGTSDGTGAAGRFYSPTGIAVDGSGHVYVTDSANHTIRKVTPDGVVTTLAGMAGVAGTADGTGGAARFRQPAAVAVDHSGNLYVADKVNQTIRKVTPEGVVTTIAGLAGSFGSSDGTGQAARFFNPSGVAVDYSGTIYVADTGNNTIRKISPAGVVSTLAGMVGQGGFADGTGSAARFTAPDGLAVDAVGNLYVTDFYTIRRISAAGQVTTLGGGPASGSVDAIYRQARFNNADQLAVDGAGNLYIADTGNNAIRFGRIALPDSGRVEAAPSPVGVARPFDVAPFNATVVEWRSVRLPSPSNGGLLSSTTIRNPTFTPDAPGRHEFLVTATNGISSSITTVSFDVEGITAAAPVITASAAQSVSASGKASTRIVATVSDADDGPGALTVTATSIPNGVSVSSISNDNGTVSATLSASCSTPVGPYTVTLEVEDSGGLTSTAALTIHVTANTPPALGSYSNTTMLAGSSTTIVPSTPPGDNGTITQITVWASETFTGTLSVNQTTGVVSVGNANAGNHSIFVRAFDDCNSTATWTVNLSVTAPFGAPPNLTAAGTSAALVSITWTPVNGATSYEIFRRAPGGMFAFLKSSTSTATSDSAVEPNKTYLYQVRAVGPSGVSPFSPADPATTILFADNPLTLGVTAKAQHIAQLRLAVNAMREAAGRSAFTFSDPGLAPGTPIRRTHIIELRTALDEARVTLALPALTYTDPALTTGTRMKAVHIQELRNGVN